MRELVEDWRGWEVVRTESAGCCWSLEKHENYQLVSLDRTFEAWNEWERKADSNRRQQTSNAEIGQADGDQCGCRHCNRNGMLVRFSNRLVGVGLESSMTVMRYGQKQGCARIREYTHAHIDRLRLDF